MPKTAILKRGTLRIPTEWCQRFQIPQDEKVFLDIREDEMIIKPHKKTEKSKAEDNEADIKLRQLLDEGFHLGATTNLDRKVIYDDID